MPNSITDPTVCSEDRTQPTAEIINASNNPTTAQSFSTIPDSITDLNVFSEDTLIISAAGRMSERKPVPTNYKTSLYVSEVIQEPIGTPALS